MRQAMQSGSMAAYRKRWRSRSCSMGGPLMFNVAFLLAGVLVIAGCVTEPPPAMPTATISPTPAVREPTHTPTATTPPTTVVREPTRAPTWTAWPKPPTADPRIAELRAWYRALGEAGPIRGVSR